MSREIKYVCWLTLVCGVFWIGSGFRTHHVVLPDYSVTKLFVVQDSPVIDLPYPISDPADPTAQAGSGINLQDPLNFQTGVVYDPISNTYVINNSVGEDINYKPPSQMTLDEYLEYDMQNFLRDNWTNLIDEKNEEEKQAIPTLNINSKKFEELFGPGGIDIRPTGTAELTFGINTSRTDNPQIPVKQRRITTFDFDERIQLNVIGTIGDKLKLSTSYNTEATFDFENQMKLEYKGYEDEIIQSIEAGNVSLPLSGSLITGSQSLFGIKSELRFGKVTVSSVFSQQKGKRSEVNVAGGAQVTQYEIKADNYEANRHYFVGHYFRNTFDQAMTTMPIVNSRVNITRIEVWVTNTNNTTTDTRNIIALTDLGETTVLENPATVVNPGAVYPDNSSNQLYANVSGNAGIRSFTGATSQLQAMGLQAARDFEKIENARKLTPSEFTYNALLGYISINQSLNNDEILGVAFQYTIGSQTYQVGEFSTDGVSGQDALVLKMLKPTIRNPRTKIWDLMMKNIYAIGAYQVSAADFQLNIWYNNPATSVLIPYLPYDGVDELPLIRILGLDKINTQSTPYPDGYFDFVPLSFNGNQGLNGGTINPQNGRVIFTSVEPFGQYLHDRLTQNGMTGQQADLIAFTELYDSTKIVAENTPSKNRFYIKGSYQSSSSSEISLGALNIPRGSVIVTSGGKALIENQDYTVDYNLGRVKIINDGLLESGAPIKVSVESNQLFNLQTKTLLGTHVDYRISKDANVGATVMRLSERPITQKVEVNDEPIKNTQIGLNGNFKKEIPLLTKWIDKLPFIETKEKSTITTSAEGAMLIPGHARAIGKDGVSYVDDFEGSQSVIDIRSFSQWTLASIPKGQPDLFPEGDLIDDVRAGFNRALISRYVIDPLFFRDNNLTPSHIAGNNSIQENHNMREVLQGEVFPNQNLPTGTPQNIPVFDVSFYPNERGPYNFEMDAEPGISMGTDNNGDLNDPATRWGGIMRMLTTTNFEAANVEFIQFWLMDPFNSDSDPNGTHQGGDLYFNLGNISEDILPDSRKAFEHGKPVDGSTTNLDVTNWGYVPTTQAIVQAFDNDPASRQFQDVGLDLLENGEESGFYAAFVNWVNGSSLTPAAKQRILQDVSNDNYHYYLGNDYNSQQLDILERYKRYTMPEGNSNTSEQDEALAAAGLLDNNISTSGTNAPDIEDINRDNNLSESESYFQYKVSLRKESMVVGSNYITDVLVTKSPAGKKISWYQFKIPVKLPNKAINGISDFRSIRFIRMFLKGWDEQITLRFARLELIRGEWRRYLDPLLSDGEYIQTDPNSTVFNIGAVNVEQNGNRQPVNYIVPPGITRETDVASANLRQLNEQSLSLEVCGLQDGDARAAYKNIDLDVRQYKRLKMFVHGEYRDKAVPAYDDDVTVFIRLGTDYTENYYEYEMPVKLTPWYDNNASAIWPEENNIEIVFDSLKNTKIERNRMSYNGGEYPINIKYTRADPDNPERRMTVVGNPNLAAIKTIMIGVRNPHKDEPNPWKPDDGLDKCMEIWVNELRLADFTEDGGYAALGRVSIQGADFMRLDLAGSFSTPGWGSIERRVSERQRETMRQFDASASFELGKFFNKDIGLRIPLFMNYSVSAVDPQYDPLNPDILWKSLSQEEQRKRALSVRDYTQTRAINFTNVSKSRPQGKKAHFYDVENLSLTYSYNEMFHRDVNIAYNMNKTWRGGVFYAFNNNPKLWQPFENNKFLKKSNWFQLVRDFGFYTGPKQITFRNDINRTDNENLIRSNIPELASFIQPQFNRQFSWNRGYDLKYDLTKNIKFDFHALNNAIIEEPVPRETINRELEPTYYDEWKDTVMQSIQKLGETMNYGHNANLNVTWPINKLPALSWVNVTTVAQTSYDWHRAPLSQDTLGNVIQNSRNVRWTGQLNFTTLYNKVPYLRDVNQKYSGNRRNNDRGRQRRPKNPKEETKDGEDKDGEKEDEKEKKEFKPLEHAANFLMMLKNVSFTYGTTDGLLLPGYAHGTQLLGMNSNWQYPGWGFIMGSQNRDLFGDTVRDYARIAAENNWLIDSTYSRWVNAQHTVNHARNINARATLEPINGMRIELNLEKDVSVNTMSNFRWDDSLAVPDYSHQNLMETGNLSLSTIMWRTAFVGVDDKTYDSKTFQDLRANRSAVSALLGTEDSYSDRHPDSTFYDGYSGTQQEVIVGAFISAYTGHNPDDKKINPFTALPLPNWRITYDGLGKIPAFKKVIQRLSITHGYRANMNISGYTTNLQAGFDPSTGEPARDVGGNFISRRQYTTVVMTEQFNPLIGFDATWNLKSKGQNNGLITKVEIKKDRNISLSLTNNQVTEVLGSELVIGSGYKFADVPFPFRIGGAEKKSDLNIRIDLSIRGNRTITRKIVENQNQITSGQRTMSIKAAADYAISKNLNIRAYFDKVVTNPFVSTTFPTANTNAGLALRFTIAQ